MGLTLLRHTTPRIAKGVCYGRLDLDLCDRFESEFRAVAASIPSVARIVSSPLSRCARLARYLADHAALPLDIDPRLTEMDFGSWEGQLWDDLPRAELDAWAADFLHARPHGGESVAMLRARVQAALEDLAGHRALLVTHAGVIKAAVARGDRQEDFDISVEFGGMIALPDPVRPK